VDTPGSLGLEQKFGQAMTGVLLEYLRALETFLDAMAEDPESLDRGAGEDLITAIFSVRFEL
jgi:hypothetical protein